MEGERFYRADDLKDIQCGGDKECPVAKIMQSVLNRIDLERNKRKEHETKNKEDRLCYIRKIDKMTGIMEKLELGFYGDKENGLKGFIDRFNDFEGYEDDIKFTKKIRKSLTYILMTIIPILIIGFIIWMFSVFHITKLMKENLSKPKIPVIMEKTIKGDNYEKESF